MRFLFAVFDILLLHARCRSFLISSFDSLAHLNCEIEDSYCFRIMINLEWINILVVHVKEWCTSNIPAWISFGVNKILFPWSVIAWSTTKTNFLLLYRWFNVVPVLKLRWIGNYLWKRYANPLSGSKRYKHRAKVMEWNVGMLEFFPMRG